MSLLFANCAQKKQDPAFTASGASPAESAVGPRSVIPSDPAAEMAKGAPHPENAIGNGIPRIAQDSLASDSHTLRAEVPAIGAVVAPSSGGSKLKQELQSEETQSAAQKQPEPAACLTFTFQHHAAAQHSLGPDCAHHKNRIALPEEVLKGEHDLNHLCVRVDGIPVMSVREKNTLILGGTPRSRSVISIRACRRGVNCHESCKIPKDELIQELTESSDSSEAGWDNESALKVNGAIDDTIRRELAALDEEEISKEWSLDGAPVEQLSASCGSGGKKTLTARKRN